MIEGRVGLGLGRVVGERRGEVCGKEDVDIGTGCRF
jgi:hypothetical protein